MALAAATVPAVITARVAATALAATTALATPTIPALSTPGHPLRLLQARLLHTNRIPLPLTGLEAPTGATQVTMTAFLVCAYYHYSLGN